MSTNIIGYTSDTNEDYIKHKEVLIACNKANIEILPKETAQFFGITYPELYVLDEALQTNIKVHEIKDDVSIGFELIISEIPTNVHKIRFTNSW